jgi:hypothetical protein
MGIQHGLMAGVLIADENMRLFIPVTIFAKLVLFVGICGRSRTM